ncbi:MAG: PEGA domain-containing protein [Calditrichaeota bacterium]|nr:PEGA domain-containing protein [Calditrichota bacterium]MCB9368156.1 PEGA domain-containing protein [Calditrichota bacterium]
MIDHSEEQRLRDLVRRELEAREELKSKEKSTEVKLTTIDELERKRIIDEEIQKFYRARGDYKQIENEDGELEWITEEEADERDKQIPVDIEELEVGQRQVRNNILLISLMVFVGVVLMFLALQQRHGNIQVHSNIEGATIVLDGVPTEFKTDNVLKDLTPGTHIISVAKNGFGIVGEAARRVELKPGAEEVLVFTLAPKERQINGQAEN